MPAPSTPLAPSPSRRAAARGTGRTSKRAGFSARRAGGVIAVLAAMALPLGAAYPAAAQSTQLANAEKPTMAVAARTLRSGSVLTGADLVLRERPRGMHPDEVVARIEDALGLETRLAIYAGRPIRPGDLGPPTIVRRNEIVTLTYVHGGLTLRTEARALEAGAKGDRIRVMNLDSRRTVTGSVAGAQHVVVK